MRIFKTIPRNIFIKPFPGDTEGRAAPTKMWIKNFRCCFINVNLMIWERILQNKKQQTIDSLRIFLFS